MSCGLMKRQVVYLGTDCSVLLVCSDCQAQPEVGLPKLQRIRADLLNKLNSPKGLVVEAVLMTN